MKLHDVVNRYNLELANKFIEDDVSMPAFEINPHDEVFELKLT